MKSFLISLWNDERGQDLTEYALLLVLLTLAAIGSLSTLATAVNAVFNRAAANLNTTTKPPEDRDSSEARRFLILSLEP